MPQSSSIPRPAGPCRSLPLAAFAIRNLLLILLAAIVAHGSPLPAQTADVQLQITPSTIQLAAGDTAKVVAVLRNKTDSALQQIQIQSLGDAGLSVRGQGPIEQVKAKSTVTWPIEISQSAPGRSVGAIQFWASYTSAGKDGVATSTLQVQELPPMDIGKLVTVKLESAIDELDEYHSAHLYLVVTNAAAVPVTVTNIELYGPNFVTLTSESAKNIVLEPQTSRAFPVQAKVGDQAAPGNYRVVFAIDLSWTDGGKLRTGAVTTAQTLPVSILGQSELLKLMGVPSFLFLPGFLALAAFGFLWLRIAPKPEHPGQYSVEEKALAAVTISILTAIVYPWLAHGRNYLNGYGLRDVVWVWFGSIGLAVGAWILGAGSLAFRARARRLKAERQARADAEAANRRMPTKNDSPSKMLDRMQANQVGLPPLQVMARLGSARPARAFLVVPAGGPIPESWVVPPIVLTRNPAGADWTRDRVVQELKKDETRADPARLAKFFAEAEKAGWTAQWGASDAVLGPSPVAANDKQDVAQAPGFNFVDAA